MHYTNETGRKLFRLALSCYRFPVVGAAGEQQIDEAEATKMVELALARGVNFFGCLMPSHQVQCEKLMGRLLAPCREDVMIAIEKELNSYVDFKGLYDSVEETISNLKTPYVDFLFLEIRDPRLWISIKTQNQLTEQLRRLLGDDKVRHIVFSLNARRVELSKEIPQSLAENSSADSMFCVYHPRDREMEDYLRQAKDAGLLNIALATMDPNSSMERKMACKFAWGSPYIDLLMVACNSVAMLEEILDYEMETRNMVMTAMERDFYSHISEGRFAKKKIRESYCNACGFCMPCPENIFVPEWVRLCEEYVKSGGSSNAEQWIQGFIRNYGDPRTICTQCKECESKCPQNLPIMYYMKGQKLTELIQ